MWVVELNIAGYTIRRRAMKRRHLLKVPAPALPIPHRAPVPAVGTSAR